MMIGIGQTQEVYSPLLSQFGVRVVQNEAGISLVPEDPCSDTSNWNLLFDPATGKCYNACEKGDMFFEVDPASCAPLIQRTATQTVSASTAAAQRPASGSWMTEQSILRGVPNWMVLLGGVVAVGLVMNN